MLPSPCDRTCVLDADENGDDRCVSCLRLPCELNWDALSEEKQKEVVNRKIDEYFPNKENNISEIDYPTTN
jgi:predicted Fe-S protein YdhL (DUF1289 family)